MNRTLRVEDLWWSRLIVRVAGFAHGTVQHLTDEARKEVHEAALRLADITRPTPGSEPR